MAKTYVTDHNGQDYTKDKLETAADKIIVTMRENEDAFSSIKNSCR